MKTPESIQIEAIRITLNFRPPNTDSGPERKPQTPVPYIDRAFRDWCDLFQTDNIFEGKIFDGNFLTQ